MAKKDSMYLHKCFVKPVTITGSGFVSILTIMHLFCIALLHNNIILAVILLYQMKIIYNSIRLINALTALGSNRSLHSSVFDLYDI